MANLFSQRQFFERFSKICPPLRSRHLGLQQPLPTDQTFCRAGTGLVSAPVCVSFTASRVSSGSTRGRGGGVRGDASSNCAGAKPVNNVAKAQKVTKRIGVTSYMRSYGVEYYSRSSRMPHMERQIFEKFCALRAKANFGSNFRKPVAGPRAPHWHVCRF